jgi:hypothetical protein
LGADEEVTALQNSRKFQVEAISALVGDLRSVKEHGSPKQRASDLAVALGKNTSDLGFSRTRANLLQQLVKSLDTDKAAIDKWLSQYETYLSVLIEQSRLIQEK